MPTSPSVQLYSVRDAIAADLQGAVARVAEIGFTKVEPHGFAERADEYARAFAAAGVTAPSGHASVIDAKDPQRFFDAAAQLGISTVIDPFIPSERWQTADDAARIAHRVNELQELAAKSNLKFGYHNHQWEFANLVDGRPIFELFAEQLSPEVVLEIDTFWVTVGGGDAPTLLRSLGERAQLLHIKDGPIGGTTHSQLPAGSGEVDVPAILAAAPHALRIVEFDDYHGDIFDGIAQSLAWLKENDV